MPHTDQRDSIDRCMRELFSGAFERRPFDALCTILRVKGLTNADWDPFEESIRCIDAFSAHLKLLAADESGMASARRVALLIYCHSVEMTAVHEMLANILRCLAGEAYVGWPFAHLIRRRRGAFRYVPPSATAKFRDLVGRARRTGQTHIADIIETFFDDRVRNAFSHADFVLTDSEFRWTQGGPAESIPVGVVDRKIATAFDFYESFLQTHRSFSMALAQGKRFHRMPQYEVLELVSESGIVCGFHVHFSNGTKATVSRRPSGTESTNVMFNDDDTVNFMVGDLDAMEPVWKIDGTPVSDWGALP